MENKKASGRFGINVEKWCKAHTAEAESLISAGTVTEKDLRRHGKMLSYLMHERLIHLIVTVLFALSMILVFGIFILSGDLYILLLLALILSLLVPYIVHYFHLENGVQTLYTLIDELEKRKEK